MTAASLFDMTRPGLRERLRSGPCLGAFWMVTGSVAAVEIAARAGPDCFVFDVQHGLWDRRTLEAAIGAVPRSIASIQRVAAGRESR